MGEGHLLSWWPCFLESFWEVRRSIYLLVIRRWQAGPGVVQPRGREAPTPPKGTPSGMTTLL